MRELNVDLLASLRAFDGQHTAILETLSVSLPRNDDLVAELLALVDGNESEVQIGATWILKRWHDEKVPEISRAVSDLVKRLKGADHWQVQLHLLQMLTSLRITSRMVPTLMKLLPSLMAGENRIIRAWALSVLANIGDQIPSHRKEVRSVLQHAESDGAASVRARLRQIQKKYPWTLQDRG